MTVSHTHPHLENDTLILQERTILLVGTEHPIAPALAECLRAWGASLILSDMDVPDTSAWMREQSKQIGSVDGVCWLDVQIADLFCASEATGEGLPTARDKVESALAWAKGFCQRQVRSVGGSFVFVLFSDNPMAALYHRAIQSMTAALAVEWAAIPLRVNCINVHWLACPLGTVQSQDVANAVAFLLADTGRWITGTTLLLDGGHAVCTPSETAQI